MEPTDGTRMLGVRLEPECNEDDEYKFRSEELRKLTAKLSTAPFSRLEANLHTKAAYLHSSITTFSQKQCQTLQRIYKPTVVKKREFNHSMPLAIRYGPVKYGGQNFQKLFDVQGSAKVCIFIEHLRANDEFGINLCIQLSVLQLKAGICEPILVTPFTTPAKYVTPTWLTMLWDYIMSHDLQIDVPDCWVPKPQHENDLAIMAVASRMFG